MKKSIVPEGLVEAVQAKGNHPQARRKRQHMPEELRINDYLQQLLDDSELCRLIALCDQVGAEQRIPVLYNGILIYPWGKGTPGLYLCMKPRDSVLTKEARINGPGFGFYRQQVTYGGMGCLLEATTPMEMARSYACVPDALQIMQGAVQKSIDEIAAAVGHRREP